MSFNTFVRTVTFSLGLVLIFFAAIQLNDVDPEYWILLYSLCACVPLLITFNRYSVRFYWLCLGMCLAALTITFHGTYVYLIKHSTSESLIQGMSDDKPYIEQTREFIGTVIALIILFISQRLYFRMQGGSPQQ